MKNLIVLSATIFGSISLFPTEETSSLYDLTTSKQQIHALFRQPYTYERNGKIQECFDRIEELINNGSCKGYILASHVASVPVNAAMKDHALKDNFLHRMPASSLFKEWQGPTIKRYELSLGSDEYEYPFLESAERRSLELLVLSQAQPDNNTEHDYALMSAYQGFIQDKFDHAHYTSQERVKLCMCIPALCASVCSYSGGYLPGILLCALGAIELSCRPVQRGCHHIHEKTCKSRLKEVFDHIETEHPGSITEPLKRLSLVRDQKPQVDELLREMAKEDIIIKH